MASSNNIIDAMNNITIEDEEEEVLAIESEEAINKTDGFDGFNANLCIVARFINDGYVEFPAMQQTLAALWKPGRGVYMKELDVNLYIFQFYHELDVKRVLEGSPWSFNRRALVMARMKQGENPRNISLNSINLWVQIHDLKPGYMSENIIKEVGNYIGTYMESCSSNFKGVWREYMRVRVSIDLNKPLKRRMKVKKAGEECYWIKFKYENVPTFCFICGILGHSEKFCSKLFDTPEQEIVKPYGVWMRAPFKRQIKQIGAKYLRHGGEEAQWNTTSSSGSNVAGEGSNQDPIIPPQNMQVGIAGVNVGGKVQNVTKGVISGISKDYDAETAKKGYSNSVIIDTKKRRTDSNSGFDIGLSPSTEILTGSDDEDNMNVENGPINNNDPKNVIEASTQRSARLAL